jgi:predicted hydrolase (HD superfamily)
MEQLADELGHDKESWGIVGLLHDLDFDTVHGDWSQHGILASRLLEGQLPDTCLYAIKSHDHRTGFPPQSLLDKALIVVDALVTSLESYWDSIASSRDIHDAIEKTSLNKPWLKELIMQRHDLGISQERLFQLALSVKSLAK